MKDAAKFKLNFTTQNASDSRLTKEVHKCDELTIRKSMQV